MNDFNVKDIFKYITDSDLKNSLKYSLNCVMICDTMGNIYYTNNGFKNILGYPLNCTEILEKNMKKFYTKTYITTVLNKIVEEKSWSGELSLSDLNNKDRCFVSNFYLVSDTNNNLFIIGMFHDETETYNVKLDSYLDSKITDFFMNQGVAAVSKKDLSGKFLKVNSLTEDIFNASNLVGKTNDDILSPKVAKVLNQRDTAAIRNKKTITTLEEIEINGITKYLSTTREPILDSFGNVISLITMSVDITEAVKYEEAFSKVVDESEKESIEKNKFFGLMEHEMKTPLNSIIGMTFLLLESNPDAKQSKYLETLLSSAQTLLAKINDLLLASKMENTDIEVTVENIELEYFISTIFKEYVHVAKEKNIELNIHVDPKIPRTIISSKEALENILTKILNNAIKFTTKGTITVNIKLQKQEAEKVTVLFEIADTGIGIKQESIEKIFTAFYQEDTSSVRHYEGMGIGLMNAAGYIKALNSKINVESEVGKGSKFFFELEFSYIPETRIEKSLAVDDDKNKLETVKNLNDVKILLVEDNLINQRIAYEILTKEGAIVTTADNGLEAIDRFKESKFSIIFMDIEMPILNGLLATEKINDLQKGNKVKIPIIGLTAHNSEEMKIKCTKAGMIKVIVKPFSVVELIDTAVLYVFGKNIEKRDLEQPINDAGQDKYITLLEKIVGLDYEEGLRRLNGNSKLYFELLLSFKNGYKEISATIRNFVK